MLYSSRDLLRDVVNEVNYSEVRRGFPFQLSVRDISRKIRDVAFRIGTFPGLPDIAHSNVISERTFSRKAPCFRELKFKVL